MVILSTVQISTAHKLLADDNASPCYIEKIPLGASLGQCCGGMVELMYERINNSATPWIQSLRQCIESGTSAVIVTSINQELHHQQDVCKLIVTESDCYGELPGLNPDMGQQAQLEKIPNVIRYARELLSHNKSAVLHQQDNICLLYTSPSPRDS